MGWVGSNTVHGRHSRSERYTGVTARKKLSGVAGFGDYDCDGGMQVTCVEATAERRGLSKHPRRIPIPKERLLSSKRMRELSLRCSYAMCFSKESKMGTIAMDENPSLHSEARVLCLLPVPVSSSLEEYMAQEQRVVTDHADSSLRETY